MAGRSKLTAGRAGTGLAMAGLLLTPLACASTTVSATSPQYAIPTPGSATVRSSAAPDWIASAAKSPAKPRAKPTAPACHPAPLEQQAAATLIVGLPNTTSPTDPLALSMPALGVGGVFLDSSNVQNAYQVAALVSAIRARREAPMVVATDEEGGRVSTFGGVLGYQPSARDSSPLGPAELESRATTLGRQLRSLGVNVDFAPVLDVTSGPWDGPIGDRSFSGDPATASADGLAVARGLSAGGVTPVIKHFPGLGAADGDTHVTAPVVTSPAWALVLGDMKPFVDAIGAGAPAVMVGDAVYPALDDSTLPASLSPAIYSRLRSASFKGVTVTDSLGMGAVNLRFDFPVAAVKALQAGVDGLLTTDGNQALRMRDAIVTAVRTHQLSAARVADAAARVTALGGGDPYPLTCLHVSLPKLH
jgi:beta-N-acetylhexosaminidase